MSSEINSTTQNSFVQEENIFYVYIYLDPNTREPFYVGKGHGNRAYDHLNRYDWDHKNCTMKRAKIKSLMRKKLMPIIYFAYKGLTEQDAFQKEQSLIAHYGRKDIGTGVLCNMSDGGEGNKGHVYTLDKKLYTVYNQDGSFVLMTRLQIRDELIGNHSETSQLFRGKCIRGWALKVEDLSDKLYVPNEKKYHFYNVHKGYYQWISKSECGDYNFKVDEFLNLIRGQAKYRCGFCLPKHRNEYMSEVIKHNSIYNFCRVCDGKVERLTIIQLAKKYDLLPTHLYQMVCGDMRHVGGWVVGDEPPEDLVRLLCTDKQYKMINIKTDEVRLMTKDELKSIASKDKASVSKVLRGEGVVLGWCLEEVQDKHRKRNLKRIHMAHDDLCDVILSKKRFCDGYDINPNWLNALLRGEREVVKGWKLKREL